MNLVQPLDIEGAVPYSPYHHRSSTHDDGGQVMTRLNEDGEEIPGPQQEIDELMGRLKAVQSIYREISNGWGNFHYFQRDTGLDNVAHENWRVTLNNARTELARMMDETVYLKALVNNKEEE